jgi:hypothetical protein
MFYKNIIIGAGPAGIQTAYFLKEQQEEYLVLEQETLCASFFSKHPLSGELISINKINTGNGIPDYNLRHDWNSLLNNDDFCFHSYSRKLYPSSEDLVQYLNDFARRFNLNIKFGCKVKCVRKTSHGYAITCGTPDGITLLRCNKLIVATGLSRPNIPECISHLDKVPHYTQCRNLLKTPNLFDNKKVLILGNGNSGFELANLLQERCSHILILGKQTRNWSIVSHYSGDVRSKYLNFLDTFFLKSLNAIDNSGHVDLDYDNASNTYVLKYPMLSVQRFDFVLNCTGWTFDETIFRFSIDMTHKYPKLTALYESWNNSGLFFVGSLMHSIDYRKSSGGFIHGFRYLIKWFVERSISNKVAQPHLFLSTDVSQNVEYNVVSHFLKRINLASSLYQMFGFMADVVVISPVDSTVIRYYEDMPYQYIFHRDSPFMISNCIIFVVTLEYGVMTNYDVRSLGHKTSKIGHESKASLLHPVVRVYDSNGLPEHCDLRISQATLNSLPCLLDEVHFDEDLFANFGSDRLYNDKFCRLLKSFL